MQRWRQQRQQGLCRDPALCHGAMHDASEEPSSAPCQSSMQGTVEYQPPLLMVCMSAGATTRMLSPAATAMPGMLRCKL
jgi:hypothetical protein